MNKQLIPAIFARQAIYDTHASVCAYELLYRAGDLNSANIDTTDEKAGDKATAQVLSYLFRHLDLNLILGHHPAFINFTRNHLLQKLPASLPKHRIVIELLENILVDELLLENIKTFSKEGYKIALDDFIFHEDLIPMINLADIIKIEVLGLTKQEINKQLTLVRESGFKGKLLAEKIENREQLIVCRDLGFDFFQGFFLNHPNLVQNQTLAEDKILLLQLFAELYNPDTQIARVEEMILQIPKLGERILKLSNSASMYQGKMINSLVDAIQRLGLSEIRNWMSLLLIAELDNVTDDLLERTLIRAKMCQILATHFDEKDSHQAFTVGLFSTLDAVLNQPMPFLLTKLQLENEINAALLTRRGTLGYLLDMTQAYEQAYFNKLGYSKFSAEDYTNAYLKGISYANNIIALIR
ncbi:putative Diguanylate phosphodiesterase (EAL domain) [Legionella nautarum]|uniref:Putative Diguanylate phosphodiesterase (EAL domain) n=1 Tax=Legionella nautarum TaxID=45070 RepID=A0A0W0WNA2_9GAMM|nr:HDOD domain-containing protein [Legionella nautarum]KTD33815.1 putative Diguanylate phosphodiesterase (EAL domain) [Legionella nautarum]